MSAASSEMLILHQYDISPFSEKVRIGLGIKGLSWHACNQPSIMPKDELVALTGGYRRIPVLQIGADLYFDSQFILEELERRFPEPTFFAGSGRGLGVGVAYWSDTVFFQTVVGLLMGSDWNTTPAFREDRSRLIGRPFDTEAMERARPALVSDLRVHLDLLGQQLSDGRAFLTGAKPDIADASLYHNIAFMRWGKGRTAALLNDFAKVCAWADRVRAIGHGQRSEISRADAIAIAKGNDPVAIDAASCRGTHDPQIGDQVLVKYNDANSPVLEGVLAHIRPRSFSIRYKTAAAGEVMLHMPRTVGKLTSKA